MSLRVQNQASERKRPKEERELLSRIKHFAQMQTAQDFEDFLNGLIYEDALKRTAAQLQGYRRAGITTLADAARYDREKADRARKAAALAESGPMGLAAMGVQASGSVRQRTDTWGARSRGTGRESSSGLGSPSLEGKDTVVPKAGRKPREYNQPSEVQHVFLRPYLLILFSFAAQPLNLSSAASLHLLTPAETTLCSTLRILPQPFLLIKQTLITEYLRRSGRLTRREARGLVRIDVNKLGKVWDFFYQQGYFDAAAAAGWAGGPGAPPGPGPSLSRSGSMNDLHGPSSGGAGGASGHGGANHRLNDVAANGPNSIPRSAAASPLANGSGSTTGAAFYQAAGSPFAASGSNNGRGAPLIAQHSHSHGQNAAGTPNAGGGSMQASPLRATAAV